jgi:hypothetical protein
VDVSYLQLNYHATAIATRIAAGDPVDAQSQDWAEDDSRVYKMEHLLNGNPAEARKWMRGTALIARWYGKVEDSDESAYPTQTDVVTAIQQRADAQAAQQYALIPPLVIEDEEDMSGNQAKKIREDYRWNQSIKRAERTEASKRFYKTAMDKMQRYEKTIETALSQLIQAADGAFGTEVRKHVNANCTSDEYDRRMLPYHKLVFLISCGSGTTNEGRLKTQRGRDFKAIKQGSDSFDKFFQRLQVCKDKCVGLGLDIPDHEVFSHITARAHISQDVFDLLKNNRVYEMSYSVTAVNEVIKIVTAVERVMRSEQASSNSSNNTKGLEDKVKRLEDQLREKHEKGQASNKYKHDKHDRQPKRHQSDSDDDNDKPAMGKRHGGKYKHGSQQNAAKRKREEAESKKKDAKKTKTGKPDGKAPKPLAPPGEQVKGNDGRLIAHIECRKCKKVGHYSDKCPGARHYSDKYPGASSDSE